MFVLHITFFLSFVLFPFKIPSDHYNRKCTLILKLEGKSLLNGLCHKFLCALFITTIPVWNSSGGGGIFSATLFVSYLQYCIGHYIMTRARNYNASLKLSTT